MIQHSKAVFWFVTGSQHLYGEETLREVQAHADEMTQGLQADPAIPYEVISKQVLTTPEAILRLCREASADEACAGIIAWMHTFSPAKMWIAGLSELKKPLLHFHTQYNRDIPWQSIDMDFMNTNQAAHGDREFGFICARMGIPRAIIAGHWQSGETCQRIGAWMRTSAAETVGRKLKVARFGDNMRQVAVTEGDKVEAQRKFGWSVNGYGIGDLVQMMAQIDDGEVDRLLQEYEAVYEIPQRVRDTALWAHVRDQARIELALETFLQNGGFEAFTTTFEDLHGMPQLPGLAVQRLMAKGYGFAGEGDWKTAALVRLMKVMADGQGTSFMEDYTYHLAPGNELVLGAHMLEICPSIAAEKPLLDVHPLGIGGKADPARLIFNGRSGSAVNASLIDLGNRFRLIVNKVEAVQPQQDMPHLPVARVLWKPQPSFQTSAEAWIRAGGAHHTCFSYVATTEQLIDWAEMVGIECLVIDEHTDAQQFRQMLALRDLSW